MVTPTSAHVCRIAAARIQEEADDRLRQGTSEGLAAELVMLLFESADADGGDRSAQPARSTGSST